MAPELFRLFLIIVVIYAFARGGRDERLVAVLCLLGAVLTTAVLSPLHNRFDNIETGVVLIDLVLFVGFVAVALGSERFWPLWVAGLQLTTMVGHILKGADASLFPKAYAAAISLWSYPILLILAFGTWRCDLYIDKPSSPSEASG